MSEPKEHEQDESERVTVVASYTFVPKACGCIDCATDGFDGRVRVCTCYCHDDPEEGLQ